MDHFLKYSIRFNGLTGVDRTACFSRRQTGLMAVIVAVCLLAGMSGCSDGRPARVLVAGQITVDGKPLEFGGIAFKPTNGGRTGGANIESGGRFSITMYELHDGLPLGSYQVLVSAVETISETYLRWHAPQKYASFETSGLIAEITEATENLKFDLSWQGDSRSKPWVERQ